MKLAHLILAHNNPVQLERLVKRLIYKNTHIYIHLDKKCNLSEFKHLELLGDVFFIKNSIAITWANYSMVQATLNSFEEILATANQYSHLNLLSGADYPLKSAATIQEYLFANAGKSFMKSKHVYKEWEETKSRFTLYSLGDYDFPFKFFIQSALNKLLPKRKLPSNLEPYGFSQWLTITSECAKYTIDYLKNNSSVRRFFRMTWAPDELVFQTVLLNSPLKSSIVNNHLRYIKFDKGGYNPKTLTISDQKDLANSDKFYARKFDPKTDTEILDYLDSIAEYELT